MSDSAPAKQFTKVPFHLAIIMDGNGRWAHRQGKSTSYGHRAGVEAVRSVLKLANDYGIKIVTLFAFSSENWQRPGAEVKALMRLFGSYLKREVNQLHADGIRIRFIGDRHRFSAGLLKQMEYAEQVTANNRESTLVIAVDYGGQQDIASAAKVIAEQVKSGALQPSQIDEALLDTYISLADLPKPDLCIRTAGEQRISNFLLWQLAYSELFFTETLWPDFGEQDMVDALSSYENRDRRYGGREGESIELDIAVDGDLSSGVDPGENRRA
ncbi:MAG: polyprenyl diphosphate synthase [Oceanicoccus sp.]